MDDELFKYKYLKYKEKYLELKAELEGGNPNDVYINSCDLKLEKKQSIRASNEGLFFNKTVTLKDEYFVLTFPGAGNDKNYYRGVISDSSGITIHDDIENNIVTIIFDDNNPEFSFIKNASNLFFNKRYTANGPVINFNTNLLGKTFRFRRVKPIFFGEIKYLCVEIKSASKIKPVYKPKKNLSIPTQTITIRKGSNPIQHPEKVAARIRGTSSPSSSSDPNRPTKLAALKAAREAREANRAAGTKTHEV